MITKAALALAIGLTAAGGISLGGTLQGVVLEVTPDAMTVQGPEGPMTFQVSNELLANTASACPSVLRGKFTQVKKGCTILLDCEVDDGQLVCVGIEVRK